jgi:hypothetical protein
MSIPTGSPDIAGGSATDAAKEEASNLATKVQEQGSAAAETLQQGAQQIAVEAKAQVAKLSEEAQKQIHAMLEQAQQEMGARASEQTEKAATNLRGLAEEFRALAEGRTEDASRLIPYVRQMGDKAGDYAERLETGGFGGLGNDLSGFARRRPGLFLLGALTAGFATARLVRGARKASSDSEESSGPASLSRPITPVPAVDAAPTLAPLQTEFDGAAVGASPPFDGALEAN